ncbi:MAG: hypothetical protein ABF370_07780, partial [Verrucomicrobiales bacterium]
LPRASISAASKDVLGITRHNQITRSRQSNSDKLLVGFRGFHALHSWEITMRREPSKEFHWKRGDIELKHRPRALRAFIDER